MIQGDKAMKQLHRMLKEIVGVFTSDIEGENFTRRELITYGVLAPLALLGVCILSEIVAAL